MPERHPTYTITCHLCGHVGDDITFQLSGQTDECWCPQCGEGLTLERPDDGDEDDDDA